MLLQFLEEDGQQILESVEWIRVRPPLEDDSLTVPLYMRYQGNSCKTEAYSDCHSLSKASSSAAAYSLSNHLLRTYVQILSCPTLVYQLLRGFVNECCL